jgi:hypothetical protein
VVPSALLDRSVATGSRPYCGLGNRHPTCFVIKESESESACESMRPRQTADYDGTIIGSAELLCLSRQRHLDRGVINRAVARL